MYSLSEPLPPDVVAHAAGPFGGYRRFPVFSAPWLKGRCAIFMPLTGGVGALEGMLTGLQLHDTLLGWETAAVSIPAWFVFCAAGPGLATFARHRLPQPRFGTTAAIVVGIVLSFGAQHLAALFSQNRVMPRYMAVFPGFDPSKWPHPSSAFTWTIWGYQFLVFSLLGGGLALLAFFREQQWSQIAEHARQLAAVDQKRVEADLRLMVLQAQVEPHFLFNTLASVHSLIRQDPARAEATLEALADHLRVTLPKLRTDVGSAHSSLAEQLEVCRSYLTVMRVRMGSRFSFVIDVEEALQRHPFPPLLLISLVENAIKHGIERTTGDGQIMIDAAVETRAGAPQLAVNVVDTGAGLRATAAMGTGLANIRAQLATRFGPQGSLALMDRTAGGAIATLRIPYEPAA
ncbi:MAG TPA: histidine kinase [Steroidobacteraceae bacterium]|nr:histidine kinase [Steroidobacteraceae bacterium]